MHFNLQINEAIREKNEGLSKLKHLNLISATILNIIKWM